MKIRYVLSFILIVPFFVLGQKRVLTFGFQFKPMIPNTIFESNFVENDFEGVNYKIDQNFGYSAGFLIRKGITNKLSLETGIGYVKRNFTLNIDSINNSFHEEDNYAIIGYEVPVVGLVFIQLSDEIFMNASFGASFDFFPSDVSNQKEVSKGDWIHETVKRKWIQTAVLANIGFEYRTKDKGIFYMGASYHRPFDYIYLSKIGIDRVGVSRPESSLELNGNYLTLDFRYFFHEDPEKKKKKKSKKTKAEMRKSYDE